MKCNLRISVLFALCSFAALSAEAAQAQSKPIWMLDHLLERDRMSRTVFLRNTGEPPPPPIVRPRDLVVTDGARASIARGDELRDKGDLNAALNEYRTAVKQARIYEGFIRLADALAATGRRTEAIEVYRDLLYPLPLDEELRFPVATEDGREVNGGYVPPDKGQAVFRLAQLLMQQGQTEEALQAYRQGTREARDLAPRSARDYLASLNFQAENLDKRTFEAATLVGQGLCNHPIKGGTENAQCKSISYFEEALDMKPRFTFAYLCMAHSYKEVAYFNALNNILVNTPSGEADKANEAEREARRLIRKVITADKAERAKNRISGRDDYNDLTAAAESVLKDVDSIENRITLIREKLAAMRKPVE